MEVDILTDAWRQRSLRTRIGIFSGSVTALLHVAIIALMIVSTPEIAVVWDWYTHLIFGRGPRQLLIGTFAAGIAGGVLASGLFNLRRESINGQSPRLWILVLLLGTVGGLLVITTLFAAFIVFVLFVADMTVHSGFAGAISALVWGLVIGVVYGIITIGALGNIFVVSLASIAVGWVSGEMIWKTTSLL